MILKKVKTKLINIKYMVNVLIFSILLIIFCIILIQIYSKIFNHNKKLSDVHIDKNNYNSSSITTSTQNNNDSINFNSITKDNIFSENDKFVHSQSLYNVYKQTDAFLTIPILNIYNAPIKEGTSQKVMKRFIGHFSNTSYENGNIGLASHNRGIGATYFEKLHKLNNGDIIIYTYKDTTRQYKVFKKVKIDSCDWSYLENTNENKITLITCINDEPNFRLCVQALEI